jgi:opine dehydrogenase
MSLPKVTVCGIGNAGMAMAADLSLMGCETNVYETPAFSSNLTAVKEQGGITLTGNTYSGKTGFAKLNKVTSNAEEAIKGVELIMIPVPAQAHLAVFENLLPYLKEGQTILVNTGYFASLRFKKLLCEQGLSNKVTIVEANIMPYLSAKTGPASANIYNYKRTMQVSVWPTSHSLKAYEMVKKVYPYKLSNNLIECNFYPGNLSLHAQIVLPKAEFFFERAREFKFYGEVSLTASKLAEAFDKERMEVLNAFECKTIDYVTWNREVYEHEGDNLYELYVKSENAKRWGRIEGIYRVLEEDICYSLIPLEEFAKVVKVKTPVTTAMIDLLQVYTGIDYRSRGLTLKDLGLENTTKEQIIDFLNNGVEILN